MIFAWCCLRPCELKCHMATSKWPGFCCAWTWVNWSHTPAILNENGRTCRNVSYQNSLQRPFNLEDDAMQSFPVHFIPCFQFGEVVFETSELRFFGPNLSQNEDRSVAIHADDRLYALMPFLISRTRRRQTNDSTNETEKKSVMSDNASIGRPGTTDGNYGIPALFLLLIFFCNKKKSTIVTSQLLWTNFCLCKLWKIMELCLSIRPRNNWMSVSHWRHLQMLFT